VQLTSGDDCVLFVLPGGVCVAGDWPFVTLMRCVDDYRRDSPCAGELQSRIISGMKFARCDKHYSQYFERTM